MSKLLLKSGIPTVHEYKELVKAENFKEIEKFSDAFIREAGSEISSYNKKWVRDPLHQWSRQWEYSYVIQQIKDHKKNKKGYRVLDLGSGVTFLPYYLINKSKVTEVVALDYDKSLQGLFDLVNKKLKTTVKFVHHDMRELNKLKAEQFDAIYSVSVLEHTDAYEKIISDSFKLLKPKGMFVLTFDISLDGLDDISIDLAQKLIKSLEKTYATPTHVKLNKLRELQGIVTSRRIAAIDKNLLPWKYPLINVVRPMLRSGKPGHPFKNLTYCCLTFIKN